MSPLSGLTSWANVGPRWRPAGRPQVEAFRDGFFSIRPGRYLAFPPPYNQGTAHLTALELMNAALAGWEHGKYELPAGVTPQDVERLVEEIVWEAKRLAEIRGPGYVVNVQWHIIDPATPATAPGAGGKDATVPEGPGAGVGTVWYHGNRSCSLDGHLPLVVSAEESNILTAFLEAGAALDTRALESHASNVSRIIKSLDKKFPGAVRKPQHKGEGYFMAVGPAPTP